MEGFPDGPVVKNPSTNAGDVSSVPKSERSPGEGNGNPLQYFCLENSMNRGDWQATVHEVAESDKTKSTHAHITLRYIIYITPQA